MYTSMCIFRYIHIYVTAITWAYMDPPMQVVFRLCTVPFVGLESHQDAQSQALHGESRQAGTDAFWNRKHPAQYR